MRLPRLPARPRYGRVAAGLRADLDAVDALPFAADFDGAVVVMPPALPDDRARAGDLPLPAGAAGDPPLVAAATFAGIRAAGFAATAGVLDAPLTRAESVAPMRSSALRRFSIELA